MTRNADGRWRLAVVAGTSEEPPVAEKTPEWMSASVAGTVATVHANEFQSRAMVGPFTQSGRLCR